MLTAAPVWAALRILLVAVGTLENDRLAAWAGKVIVNAAGARRARGYIDALFGHGVALT